MAHQAPFATLSVESPPWHKEKPRWSVSDRFGKRMTDIMLDGSGYHGGYTNYNGVHETPKRLAKRLAEQKAGLTGRFKLKAAGTEMGDDWGGSLLSPQQSRLLTPIGSSPSRDTVQLLKEVCASTASLAVTSPEGSCSPTSASRAATAVGSKRRSAAPGSCSPTSPSRVERSATAVGSTRQRPSSQSQGRLTRIDGGSPKAMTRCSTAPTPDWSKTLSHPVEMNASVWSESFEKMFRQRDRRHADWNARAFYEDCGGTLTRPPHFLTMGPAHPFAATWDSPSTKWSASYKGNTLSPITRESMTIPGI